MKGMALLAAAAVAVGAAQLANGANGVALDEPAVSVGDPSIYYRLHVLGESESCRIEKGPAARGGDSQLLAGEKCAAIFPAIGRARAWRESDEGTVDFVDQSGGVVAAFAVADGSAYESFSPGLPIMALVAVAE